jgi:hypothetical protein
MSFNIDNANAAVLPEPVWDCHTTSLPDNNTGITAS